MGDNPDSLRAVQTKLDNDLRTFEDSIWVKDPAPSANEKKSRKDRLQERIEAKVEALENADGDIEPNVNRRTKEQVDMEAAAEEKFQKATTRKSVRRNRN